MLIHKRAKSLMTSARMRRRKRKRVTSTVTKGNGRNIKYGPVKVSTGTLKYGKRAEMGQLVKQPQPKYKR